MSSRTDSKWTTAIAVGITALCVVPLACFVRSTFVIPKTKVKDVPTTCKKEDGYDEIVTVYVVGGKSKAISPSPFTTKLVTYLRLTGIPHIIKEADFSRAPKGKAPYIEHAGATLGDTQLVIRYFENVFDITRMSMGALQYLPELSQAFVPFSRLSRDEQAHSDAVRLLCEGEIYWAITCMRWGGDIGLSGSESAWVATRDSLFSDIPTFLLRSLISSSIRVVMVRNAWGQGLLRHSPADQLYLAQRAIKCLSTLLHDKSYFLGDFMTECDCTAFGTIDCLLDPHYGDNPLLSYIQKDCSNLIAYHQRIRNTVFPDVQPEDCRPPSREFGAPLPKLRRMP